MLSKLLILSALLIAFPAPAFSGTCHADENFCLLQDYEPGLILAIRAKGKAAGCAQMNLENGFPREDSWPDTTSIAGDNERRCLHVQRSCPEQYPITLKGARAYYHQYCD